MLIDYYLYDNNCISMIREKKENLFFDLKHAEAIKCLAIEV